MAGGLLGVAFGGFFDGILIHQILQWHHLLSAIDSDNVRLQVMADGLFHALMYVLTLAGLWLLWRAAGTARVAAVPLLVSMLAGFGAWHLLDAVLSHWILGIHRLRMDSTTPLFWDLLWLAVFGIGPISAAWWISHTLSGPGRGASNTLFSAASSVDARVAWTDASGSLVVLAHAPGNRSPLRLLMDGAIALGSALLPAACFSGLRS